MKAVSTPAKLSACLLLLGLLLTVMAGCEGNRCDRYSNPEVRSECNYRLIEYDRQLRGNRAYRTL